MTLYQATIATQHSVKASGLDGIWAKLRDYFPGMRTYNNGLKWRLVFIVPEDVAPEWVLAQPVTDTRSRKWQSLEQYVVPFPVDRKRGTYVDTSSQGSDRITDLVALDNSTV